MPNSKSQLNFMFPVKPNEHSLNMLYYIFIIHRRMFSESDNNAH